MLRIIIFAACCLLLINCNKQESLTIIFGGDVMLDRGVRSQINRYGIDYLFTDVQAEFKAADFGIVNLECPITSTSSPLVKQFIFRGEPEWVSGLYQNGITHCILANNHSYDQGRHGLVATAENLKKENVVPVGYGLTQASACEPALLHKNNIEVALFSSVTLPLEAWTYLEDSAGMCQATIEDLTNAIAIFRQSNPKTIIVVSLHWGIEYRKIPNADQRKQAELLINAGADALIGHHPHVVQTYEKIKGKPVFYSIGNLIFDNPKPQTHEGILIKLTVTQTGLSETEIISYDAQNIKPFVRNSNRKIF